jgi:hypothetical protein
LKSSREARSIDGPLHFALLSAATLLVVASPWRIAPGLGAEFALFGACHACSVGVSVQPRAAPFRQVLFVAAAALLSLLTARCGFYGIQVAAKLYPIAAPLVILVAMAVLGALAYATLIRRALDYPMPPGSPAPIAAACAIVTIAAYSVCRHYRVFGGTWLAIPWWFAFSLSLKVQEHRRPGRRG